MIRSKIRINGRRKELRDSVRLPACFPVRAAKVTDGPRRGKAEPDGSGKKQHRKGAVFYARSLALRCAFAARPFSMRP